MSGWGIIFSQLRGQSFDPSGLSSRISGHASLRRPILGAVKDMQAVLSQETWKSLWL